MEKKVLTKNISLIERTLVIVAQESIILIEPGYDAACKGSFVGSSVEEVIKISHALNKPISHIVYSHYHGDHVGNIPFYLKRISTQVKLVSHSNSPVPNQFLAVRLVKQEDITSVYQTQNYKWDSIELQIIPTPGHSFQSDDISVFLPKEKILCVGDIWQPQGKSYESSDGVSPVPFFFYGDDYIRSLLLLKQYDFNTLITGHGDILSNEEGRTGLQITEQTLFRMQALAKEFCHKYPKEVAENICELVYNAIVKERNFNPQIAHQRKQFQQQKKSDYEIYDRPGLKYFVHQAQEQQTAK